MTKSELITQIASEAGISKKQASAALDSTVACITESLKKGDRVTLVRFGTLITSQRKARTGRNPRTGRPIKIATSKTGRFISGEELKRAVGKKPKPKLDAFEATFEELSDRY